MMPRYFIIFREPSKHKRANKNACLLQLRKQRQPMTRQSDMCSLTRDKLLNQLNGRQVYSHDKFQQLSCRVMLDVCYRRRLRQAAYVFLKKTSASPLCKVMLPNHLFVLLLNLLTCFHVNQTKRYEFSHVRFEHSSRHVSLNKTAGDKIKQFHCEQ